MATTIVAAIQDLIRADWAKMLGGLLNPTSQLDAALVLSYFKVGEGGWQDPGSGRVARDPFAHVAEQDIDAIIDASRPLIDQRYAATERGNFQKSFVGGDLVFVAATTLKCRVFLDFGEFNDDGNGNDPEIWEVGVYDILDRLVAYGTFPKVTKNAGAQVERFVEITF
jgi:hypothetical protein